MICEPIPIAISLCVLLRSAHAACQITNEKLFPPTLVYMRADKRRSADDVSASALCRRLCCCWSFFFFSLLLFGWSTIVYRYIDKELTRYTCLYILPHLCTGKKLEATSE